MSLARKLAPAFANALTSTTLRDVQRTAAEWRRRLARAPHRVEYFHQVDDPYSHLAAQTLGRLAERYDIELVAHLVGPPSDDAAPERERLEAFSRKDAADVAPAYGLAFPRHAAPPPPDVSARVAADLAATPAAQFSRRAVALGTALWQGEYATIERLAAGGAGDATRARAAGDARRHKLGHYLSGMFYYGGEWYWGVDRLHYLEARLRALGAARTGSPQTPIVPIPGAAIPPSPAAAPTEPVTLEFFGSLRSPYSYIVWQRVLDAPRRFPIELTLRPVLPMVMRGLAVPQAKRLYIVRDTKREADRCGVPFGRVCDPVGEPVEKGFALYHWARDQGRAGEYLFAFARAAFAEGVDTGTDAGLRHVVEAAGLSWAAAQAHRDDSAWRAELEANRQCLFELGLWGVPSFRVRGGGLPEFVTWGQDRWWLVEREIAARLAP